MSWKPVRKGKLYCSPACGRGCTWKEYWAACLIAGEICRDLGPGWVPNVTENLGWFVGVQRDGFRVSYYPKEKLSLVGRPDGGVIGRGRTPRSALRNARKELEREACSANTVLWNLKRAME